MKKQIVLLILSGFLAFSQNTVPAEELTDGAGFTTELLSEEGALEENGISGELLYLQSPDGPATVSESEEYTTEYIVAGLRTTQTGGYVSKIMEDAVLGIKVTNSDGKEIQREIAASFNGKNNLYSAGSSYKVLFIGDRHTYADVEVLPRGVYKLGLRISDGNTSKDVVLNEGSIQIEDSEYPKIIDVQTTNPYQLPYKEGDVLAVIKVSYDPTDTDVESIEVKELGSGIGYTGRSDETVDIEWDLNGSRKDIQDLRNWREDAVWRLHVYWDTYDKGDVYKECRFLAPVWKEISPGQNVQVKPQEVIHFSYAVPNSGLYWIGFEVPGGGLPNTALKRYMNGTYEGNEIGTRSVYDPLGPAYLLEADKGDLLEYYIRTLDEEYDLTIRADYLKTITAAEIKDMTISSPEEFADLRVPMLITYSDGSTETVNAVPHWTVGSKNHDNWRCRLYTAPGTPYVLTGQEVDASDLFKGRDRVYVRAELNSSYIDQTFTVGNYAKILLQPDVTVAPQPTAAPETSPVPDPTATPTPDATITPTPKPTAAPTVKPTATPTPKPKTSPVPAPVVGGTSITAVYNSVNGADIRWKKADGATGYYIYRKRAVEGTKLITTINNANTLQCFDPEIKNNAWGKVYHYYVVPFSGKTKGPQSEAVALQRLAPMTITSCKNNNGKAEVKWTCSVSSNKAFGYELQYAASKDDLFNQKGSFKKSFIAGRNNLSRTVTGLTTGQTYYFRVRCYVDYTHSATKKSTRTWSQYSNVANMKATVGEKGTFYYWGMLLGETDSTSSDRNKEGVIKAFQRDGDTVKIYASFGKTTGSSYTNVQYVPYKWHTFKISTGAAIRGYDEDQLIFYQSANKYFDSFSDMRYHYGPMFCMKVVDGVIMEGWLIS